MPTDRATLKLLDGGGAIAANTSAETDCMAGHIGLEL
jgi:hypothetical protein